MPRTTKLSLRLLVAESLMTALIAVCSFIALPFFLIPITMQTYGIYFALFFLGGRAGFISVLLYVAIGAVGLPVFSGFSGGIARLFDAGGGFIWGFLIAALVFWVLTAFLPSGRGVFVIASALSLLSLYLTGTLWYALVYLNGAGDILYVLGVCVFPFILPDILKIALAYILSRKLSGVIKI